MSQRIFSSVLLVALVLVFILFCDRIILYLKAGYPNLDSGIVVSLAGFICIGVSLAISLFATLLHYWFSSMNNS